MDKMISWNDSGSECTFAACAETETGLFEKVLEHGRMAHGMKEFSPDLYNKVRASIRDGYCDLEDQFANTESVAVKLGQFFTVCPNWDAKFGT